MVRSNSLESLARRELRSPRSPVRNPGQPQSGVAEQPAFESPSNPSRVDRWEPSAQRDLAIFFPQANRPRNTPVYRLANFESNFYPSTLSRLDFAARGSNSAIITRRSNRFIPPDEAMETDTELIGY